MNRIRRWWAKQRKYFGWSYIRAIVTFSDHPTDKDF